MQPIRIANLMKDLGKNMERHLPITCLPITIHRIVVHSVESIDVTGPLSGNLGQWIEDVCLEVVEQSRKRDLKVNPEATLAKALTLKHILMEFEGDLPDPLEFAPITQRVIDERFYDSADAYGLQFHGKGTVTVFDDQVRQEIASFLSVLLRRKEGEVRSCLPQSAMIFRSATIWSKVHSTEYVAARKTNSTCVGVLYATNNGEAEYFGRVTSFIRITFEDVVYKLARLDLYKNASNSAGGQPRVQDALYRKGRVVEIASITRKVILAKRVSADNFSFVLDLRHELPTRYTAVAE